MDVKPVLVLRIAPAAFVFLWSTGFVGAKYGMQGAEPATYLTLRFMVAFFLLASLALALKAKPLPRPIDYWHAVVVGFLVHVVYLGGVFAAIYHGLPAGVSAIIVSINPLLVAFLGHCYLGERLSWLNKSGLVLGLAGVVMVVGGDALPYAQGTFSSSSHVLAVLLCVASLLGMSCGTLYQKRYCANFDLLTGTAVQYIGAMVLLSVPMLLFETRQINWTPGVLGAFIWLVIALSVCAILLLMLMIKHGEANRVASLFYLVPGLAGLETWLLFDERLSVVGCGGILLCMLGVYLARHTSSDNKFAIQDKP